MQIQLNHTHSHARTYQPHSYRFLFTLTPTHLHMLITQVTFIYVHTVTHFTLIQAFTHCHPLAHTSSYFHTQQHAHPIHTHTTSLSKAQRVLALLTGDCLRSTHLKNLRRFPLTTCGEPYTPALFQDFFPYAH